MPGRPRGTVARLFFLVEACRRNGRKRAPERRKGIRKKNEGFFATVGMTVFEESKGFVWTAESKSMTKKFVLAGLQCDREKTSRLRLPGTTTPRRWPSGEMENSRKLRP